MPIIFPVSNLWFLVAMEKYKAISNTPLKLYGSINSCVQFMKNKSSEKWYEKYPSYKIYKKIIFFLLTRKHLKGSHYNHFRNGDEKKYKRKDEKKLLHRRSKDT